MEFWTSKATFFGGQKVVKDTQVACPANIPTKSPLPCFSGSKILPFAYQNAQAIKKTQDLASHLQKTDSFWKEPQL